MGYHVNIGYFIQLPFLPFSPYKNIKISYLSPHVVESTVMLCHAFLSQANLSFAYCRAKCHSHINDIVLQPEVILTVLQVRRRRALRRAGAGRFRYQLCGRRVHGSFLSGGDIMEIPYRWVSTRPPSQWTLPIYSLLMMKSIESVRGLVILGSILKAVVSLLLWLNIGLFSPLGYVVHL